MDKQEAPLMLMVALWSGRTFTQGSSLSISPCLKVSQDEGVALVTR